MVVRTPPAVSLYHRFENELFAGVLARVQGSQAVVLDVYKRQAQDCTDPAVPACALSQVWFIAYAPADHPKIAIAVTMEKQNGFGGTIAAPVAKEVLEALGIGSSG